MRDLLIVACCFAVGFALARPRRERTAEPGCCGATNADGLACDRRVKHGGHHCANFGPITVNWSRNYRSESHPTAARAVSPDAQGDET